MISDMDAMKERFSKLLLGEDMSGGGKGVPSALALSNAITNLAGMLDSCSNPMLADIYFLYLSVIAAKVFTLSCNAQLTYLRSVVTSISRVLN